MNESLNALGAPQNSFDSDTLDAFDTLGTSNILAEVDRWNTSDTMDTSDVLAAWNTSDVSSEVSLNCSSCSNELCLSDLDYATYESWVSVDLFERVFVLLNLLVFVAGIVGNSLVCLAVKTNKSMQSVTNIFIVNLALADFLVMLFCAPPSVIWDVTNTWIFGSLMCKIVIFIQDLSVSVSVLTLTFIAYDRFHAICRPLQFNSHRTHAAPIIVAIWSVSALIGVPDAVTLSSRSPFEDMACFDSEAVLFDMSACVPSWSKDVDFGIILIKAVLLYSLPLLFMWAAYYRIVRALWKSNNVPGYVEFRTMRRANGGNVSSHSLNEASESVATATLRTTMTASTTNSSSNTTTTTATRNKGLDNQLRSRRKVAKMLIAVVTMFSINFFPVHCIPILRYAVERLYSEGGPVYERINDALMYAGIVTHFMVYFNSCINPIIYYFMSAQFKTQYRRIVRCQCGREQERQEQARLVLLNGLEHQQQEQEQQRQRQQRRTLRRQANLDNNELL